jgi:hypothetical protein
MYLLSLLACGGGGSSTSTPPPPSTFVLTVTTVNPNSGVAIAVTPADNNSAGNGTTTFIRTYSSGSAVTLTAPATAGGNIFLSWSGCSSSSNLTCNVTMNANYTVTATYTAPVVYTLTMNSIYPSSGVPISASPADNNSNTSGSTGFTLSYNQGTAVTLTAPATAGGKSFSSWSGCDSATTVTCTVTINANTIVIASYSAPVSSLTYYVSGTGSDSNDGLSTATAFRTLQHAADLTQPGDTVLAMNGTYNNICAGCAVLDIHNPGTASDWITYKAYPGQTPVLSFNGWEGIFVESTASYIEVNGFTIIGNNANVTLAGALAQSTTNPDPIYNGGGIAVDGRAGNNTIRPNHINILNNTISECSGGGVGAMWSDYITISGNTIYNTSYYSIYGDSGISTGELWNSDASTGYKIFITGNRLFGNKQLVPTALGGGITDGEAIIIDSNRNHNAPAIAAIDPMPPYTGRTLIANNVIYANGSSAVEVFESDHVDVVNNSSYQNVTNPPLSGRGELDLNQTTDVNAFNNVFYNATGQNPVAIEPGTTSSIVLDYNLYYNGSNTGDVANGAHDLTANPLYVDPADANPLDVLLTVSSSSPAVGTGTSNLAPTTDFAGNPRPGSKGIDRGAYQQP